MTMATAPSYTKDSSSSGNNNPKSPSPVSKIRGILQIVSPTISADSSTDQPSNMHTLTKECSALLDQSEQLNLNMTNLKHQYQMVSQAIESGRPPNGLTPHVVVNAQDKTEFLEQEIADILHKADLDICRALQAHYHVTIDSKDTRNGEISESLENKLSQLLSGPQTTELIKLVQDRVLDIKSKTDKREAELALRMSGKRKRTDGDREAPPDQDDTSSSKKPKSRSVGESSNIKHDIKECIRQVMRTYLTYKRD